MTASSGESIPEEAAAPAGEPVSGAGESTERRWTRVVPAAIGGVLVATGLRRRSPFGYLLAAAGSWLAYRGARGTDPLSTRLERSGGDSIERVAGEEQRASAEDPTTIRRSVTVNAGDVDLLNYCRDPAELDRIAGGYASVTRGAGDHLRWQVDLPFGYSTAWEERIIEERPDELLRWETVEGAAVPHEGTVRLEGAPGDRGTEVTAEVRLDPPGGALGMRVLAAVGIVPEAILATVLRRFKNLAEAGEIPTLEGNPSARGAGDLV